MPPIRLAILAALAVLLAGGTSSNQGAQAERFEGSWEITSVQRDGEPDPLQVGAQMTFTVNEVAFQPKAVQINDGTG
jgi:hypothetical protein